MSWVPSLLGSKGILLLFGLGTSVALIVIIGPEKIYSAGTRLGGAGLAVMLIPSSIMYLLDCLGWRLTLGRCQAAVPFSQLFVIRMAGELVNTTTPLAYVGGEPLKANLLKAFSIPMVDGLASVIVAKTTMTIAQIFYIILGMGLGIWILGSPESAGASDVFGMAAVVSVALLLFATSIFIVVQRQGLFACLFSVLARCRIRFASVEAKRGKLLELDAAIAAFYGRDRASFLLSTAAFFSGWLTEAMEVYFLLTYLGEPVDVWTALSIDALATIIKGGTFFIPGSVGAQEAGNVVLLTVYGYSDVTGMTFALLRRVRELVWIGVGLLCLAFMMRRVGSGFMSRTQIAP